VNAGRLAADHWINDAEDGGGRLLGEGCHFVDLACWLVGTVPTTVHATIHPLESEVLQATQRFTISLGFADGSLATVLYSDQGAKNLTKEYVEAHADGRSGVLHDFRRLELFDGRSRKEVKSRKQDKGHHMQFAHLRKQLESQPTGLQLDPLDTMHAALAALRSAQVGRAQSLDLSNDSS
jgi:polar amino acid transport system substrate-binding protein